MLLPIFVIADGSVCFSNVEILTFLADCCVCCSCCCLVYVVLQLCILQFSHILHQNYFSFDFFLSRMASLFLVYVMFLLFDIFFCDQLQGCLYMTINVCSVHRSFHLHSYLSNCLVSEVVVYLHLAIVSYIWNCWQFLERHFPYILPFISYFFLSDSLSYSSLSPSIFLRTLEVLLQLITTCSSACVSALLLAFNLSITMFKLCLYFLRCFLIICQVFFFLMSRLTLANFLALMFILIEGCFSRHILLLLISDL